MGQKVHSWTTGKDLQIEDIKTGYQLSDESIQLIRQWVDAAFNDKRIGWINLFKDLAVAKEYIRNFFSHLSDIKIIAIYFHEPEIPRLLSEFQPAGENRGTIGLYENLMKRIPETKINRNSLLGMMLLGSKWTGDSILVIAMTFLTG